MDNVDKIRTIPLLLDYVCNKHKELELFTLYDAKNQAVQTKISYKEFLPIIKKFQALLTIEPCRIVIYLDSDTLWLTVFFAIVCSGHVAVLVDGGLKIGDVLQQIRQSDAALIVTNSKRLAKIKIEDTDQLPTILNIDNLTAATNDNIKVSTTNIIPTSLAAIVYTSGSTGNPKGVMLSHQAFCLSAFSGPEPLFLPFKSLVILPLWHILGLANCVLSMMVKGCSLYFCQTMKPNLLLSTLEKCQIDHMTTTPIFCEAIYKKMLQGVNKLVWYKRIPIKCLHQLCQFMLQYSQRKTYSFAQFLFKSIRAEISPNFNFILSGGARLNPEIIKALLGFGYVVMEGYGLSETCGAIACTQPFNFKANCVGGINPWCDVKILHKDKRGIGEICLKTKQLMDGYLNQPELTRNVYTEDGWFKTGDLGYANKTRHLFISGRLKDIIVTPAGKNIYPDDVEQCFSHMLYIEELCCYGQEIKNGEEIMLVIRLTPGLTTEQITNAVAEVKLQNVDLPSYSQASRILFVDKKLPRTVTKKVDRKKVKAQFLAKSKKSIFLRALLWQIKT